MLKTALAVIAGSWAAYFAFGNSPTVALSMTAGALLVALLTRQENSND